MLPLSEVIKFKEGQTEIPPDGVDQLTQLAKEIRAKVSQCRELKPPRAYQISISGHTSVDPDEAPAKFKLQNESRERAVAVGP